MSQLVAEGDMKDVDPAFYDRADAHIQLSNAQFDQAKEPGIVSASMLYATARFNVWLTARGFESGDQLRQAGEETLDYFCEQYRLMLEEHLDDYAANFDSYMGAK